MKFTFHWAHHVWHHDQIANWHVSERFDIRVLNWLKQNYWYLVHHHPWVMDRYGGVVLLFYRCGTDTFGRSYTEISAAFCATLRRRHRWLALSTVWKGCAQALVETPDRLDPITLDISWHTVIRVVTQQVSQVIEVYRRWLVIGFVSVGLLLLVWIGFGDHHLFEE